MYRTVLFAFLLALLGVAASAVGFHERDYHRYHHQGAKKVAAPKKGLGHAAEWSDMYAPPYTQVPQIAIGISCLDKDNCYLAGGANGIGFGVYKYDGKLNGQITRLNTPSRQMMVETIAMAGTPASPKGAFAGFNLVGGFQYAANATTFLPALDLDAFVETQEIRISKDGNTLISPVNDIQGTGFMVSRDGGKAWARKAYKGIRLPENCTSSKRAAYIDENTFYVTMGSFPDQDKATRANGKSMHQLSQLRSAGIARDGTVRHTTRYAGPKTTDPADVDIDDFGFSSSSSSDQICFNYSGMILKTTDGGNTWQTQVSFVNTNRYFVGIDCAPGGMSCVAVAEGTNMPNPGSSVWHTSNGGATWKTVLEVPTTAAGQYSMIAVRYRTATEVWIGGSEMKDRSSSKGMFWKSTDAGATWVRFGAGVPDIYQVMDITFTNDGVGYAAAMTMFRDSTILRYTPAGPGPEPYPDTYFQQKQCVLPGCKELCQTISFPQGMCMPIQGGSMIASCDVSQNALVQKFYGTTSCVGGFTTRHAPLNKCEKDTRGTYFETLCGGSNSTKAHSGQTVRFAV